MKKITRPLFFVFTLSAFYTAAFSLPQPTLSITGNPIKRKDNYTINSAKAMTVHLNCVFVNSGQAPAKLQVWTNPNTLKPHSTIQLESGNKAKPAQVAKEFYLPLKQKWWCRINAPKGQKEKWAYCSYFSISDATISKRKPFATWDRTIHSKDTSYHCRIKKPNGTVNIFYFK